jgi:hypothetical protein
MRTEYESQLQKDDKSNNIEENMEYYADLTQLLYEKYDINEDGGLD